MLRRAVVVAAALAVASLASCGGGGSAPAPTCSDGVKNGAETGLDCGGSCPKCGTGLGCQGGGDCQGGVCASGTCAAPSCADAVRNGTETDVDCGGQCTRCGDRQACLAPADCQSGVCGGNTCRAASCADTVRNGAETDVDCGGPCEPCGDQKACLAPADCQSGVCDGLTCAQATCQDAVRNHGEADVDCGGPCSACLEGARCGVNGDCASSLCQAGACRPPSCADGTLDGDESDLDCGGSCEPCVLGKGCGAGPDCQSGVCQAGACRAAACASGAKDGAETDVDCGGGCAPCADGRACQANGDCASGNCGAGGTCLAAPGAACAADAGCATGFCADGVCCAQRCGGTCEACNLPGRAGSCDPVPAGADPASECADQGAASCGTSGACAGNRTCARYLAGTACAPASCSGATSHGVGACDAGGSCVPGPLQDCGALGCDPASGACRTTCAGPGDCAAGFSCVAGACKKIQGGGCAVDLECASGFCTDGVCCAARCGGACEACNLPSREGSCDPVPASADPAEECADQGAASCGTSGACSGARTCARYPAGTTCAAATCSGPTATPASTCDGAGACLPHASQSCPPYACDAASGQCRTSCVGPTDCAGGFACLAGTCRKAQGQACFTDGDCASGFCTDGFCCDARCGGTCERCSQTGQLGTCAAVPAGQDPDNDCPTEATSTCGQTGACDGNRTCALQPAGITCLAASCSASVLVRADTCSGAGACVDRGQTDCAPYGCNAGTASCRTSCVADGDCASGYGCGAGTCRKLTGGSCQVDGDCLSGGCCSGTCRDQATDAANCGACGVTCLAQGGTNACVAGGCQPTCDPLWASCDGDPKNGCETPLTSLTDCGSCGTVCTRTSASATCATGSCAIAACQDLQASCDGVDDNGCETSLLAGPACGAALALGNVRGDVGADLLRATGHGSDWFRFTVSEADVRAILFNPVNLTLRVTLTPGAGNDYDIFLYAACGGAFLGAGQAGGDAPEVLLLNRTETAADDGYEVWVEVRPFRANTCSDYTLVVEGHP